MSSKNEELLQSILDGTPTDCKPQSRAEAYLKACCNCSGSDGLPAPQSRNDALLYQLADELSGGGSYTNLLRTESVLLNTRMSASSDDFVTDNGFITIKNIAINAGNKSIRFRGLQRLNEGYLVLSHNADEVFQMLYNPALSEDGNGDSVISFNNPDYEYCHIALSYFDEKTQITASDIQNCIVTLNEEIK